jgi:hypothetical protein
LNHLNPVECTVCDIVADDGGRMVWSMQNQVMAGVFEADLEILKLTD